MPCASLFSELKLHGANSTTPRGGRGRIARSKYDSTTCAPATSASSRGAMTREAFGVGIAMTVEKPSPTSPRRISGQRAAVVVPLSDQVGDVEALDAAADHALTSLTGCPSVRHASASAFLVRSIRLSISRNSLLPCTPDAASDRRSGGAG